MRTFHPTTSLSIEQVEYDDVLYILTVTFKRNGEKYEYLSVPESVYSELTRAASVGGYFHTYIRDKYSSRKIGMKTREPAN